MEALPLISVIVPIYKIPNYIDRCLKSICEQSYKNLEIILVDDGSPDECPQKCDEWSKNDARIQVIHKSNGGLSDARNAGIKKATGEYISFIDGDDWIEEDFFTVLMHLIKKNDADIAEVGYRYYIEGKAYKKTNLQYECENIDRYHAMQSLIENKIPQVVWNKLYKRDIVTDIPFVLGKYHEDEFWTYQVIDRVNIYTRGEYVGYNYFQRNDSIMGEAYSVKRLDAIEAKVCRQKYLELHKNKLADAARKNLLFSCLYHGQCARRELIGKDRRHALCLLKETFLANRMSPKEYKQMRISQQIWIRLGCLSFDVSCGIRNLLTIGL